MTEPTQSSPSPSWLRSARIRGLVIGAAIGGSIGAGAGTAATAAGGRNAATLPSGSPVTVRIEHPVVVTVER